MSTKKKSFVNTGNDVVSKYFSEQSEPITEISDVSTITDSEQHNSNNVVENEMIKKKIDEVKHSKLRTTILLEDEARKYLDIMVRLDGSNLTKYLHSLIENDMKVRSGDYEMALKLFKKFS